MPRWTMWAVIICLLILAMVCFGLMRRIDDLEVRLKATEIQVRSLSGQTNGFIHRGF